MTEFYGVDIAKPLSSYHNTTAYDTSPIGQLHARSKHIWIDELPKPITAPYVWRITSVRLSDEDGTMSYFEAWDYHGAYRADARFGVTWDDCPHRIDWPGNGRYYVPISGFSTVNQGGYFVKVLDRNYPSERLAFGMVASGKQHQALIVQFRLFAVGENYPNDYEVE